MNAVIIAVVVMLALSLFRVNVVLSLIVGSLVGGLTGGLGLEHTIEVFANGLGGSAEVALSYALLGGFAAAISAAGLPNALVDWILGMVAKNGEHKAKTYSKIMIISVILLMSIFSQNLIPIHIAFIPILIPPLLFIFNELNIDRRLIASVLTFGLVTPYILLPAGFGAIFHGILQTNIAESGLEINASDIPTAMLLPAVGMVVGLLVAVFISYRKPRSYVQNNKMEMTKGSYTKRGIVFSILAIIAALALQLITGSMIIGALVGIVVIYMSGTIEWREADNLLTEGMKMMAFIGFVMIAANGFAAVINATGDVDSLITNSLTVLEGNRSLAVFIMLVIGLVVTMGIGSSFATVPIIATLFVPLAQGLDMSPLAILCLIGTAGALGDAGSPASDSTLGPTAGLNVDGQHHHIWDTCVPTFIFINIPLILFGWIACVFFL